MYSSHDMFRVSWAGTWWRAAWRRSPSRTTFPVSVSTGWRLTWARLCCCTAPVSGRDSRSCCPPTRCALISAPPAAVSCCCDAASDQTSASRSLQIPDSRHLLHLRRFAKVTGGLVFLTALSGMSKHMTSVYYKWFICVHHYFETMCTSYPKARRVSAWNSYQTTTLYCNPLWVNVCAKRINVMSELCRDWSMREKEKLQMECKNVDKKICIYNNGCWKSNVCMNTSRILQLNDIQKKNISL